MMPVDQRTQNADRTQLLQSHRVRLQEQQGQYTDLLSKATRMPDKIPVSQLRISPETDAPWWSNMGQEVVPFRPAAGNDGKDAQTLIEQYKTKYCVPDLLFLMVKDHAIGNHRLSVSIVNPQDLLKDVRTLEIETAIAAQNSDWVHLFALRTALLAVSGRSGGYSQPL